MRTTSLTMIGLTALLSIGTTVLSAPSATGAPGAVSAAAATCDGRPATIVVQPSPGAAEWVVGTPGDDVIVGTDRGDRIDGAGGNDTICALGGADQIIGGPGDDRLFGGNDDYFPDEDYWGDVIAPGAGDDYVDLGAELGPDDIYWADRVYSDKVSYADAPGPVTVDLSSLTATGHGTDTFAPTDADLSTGIVGSPFADVLTGGPAHDQIHGGGGNDVITGGPGDDDLDGDAASELDHTSQSVPGDDVVSGGGGDDAVSGGHGRDQLRGEEGDDYLVGRSGAVDTLLLGGAGSDTLGPVAGTEARGGPGDDVFTVVLKRIEPGELGRTLVGGSGRDRVVFDYYGGRNPGYDLVVDVPRRVIRHLGERYATLLSAEEFVIDGNAAPGSVTFRGGPKPELFQVKNAYGFPVRAFGRGGNDVLIGGDRGDLLHGGAGRDRVVGGQGRDRCVAAERVRSCERRG